MRTKCFLVNWSCVGEIAKNWNQCQHKKIVMVIEPGRLYMYVFINVCVVVKNESKSK